MTRLIPTARESGLLRCDGCGLVVPLRLNGQCCARCGATLRSRHRNSVAHCWAYLIAAAILYVPANLLPMMLTSSFMDSRTDTIFSGVVELWTEGAWDLAVIVFVASIVVPVVKILVLGWLLITLRSKRKRNLRERARLYRVLEAIGHWSMLDVFVVAMLVTLVHFQPIAQVKAGPAAIAFGSVVILTMLSALSFDPRLIWDPPSEDKK